ncbi:MAG: acyl-CoA dehydrogenase, partial [Proteobacteria bacterium]|nr:acyl-CoA dehydrogenase [Pseudomonadota bacterium]
MNLNYGPEYKNFKKEVISFCKKWEGVHFVDEAKSPLTPITKVGGKKITRTEWQSILIKEGYFARSIPKEYGGYGGESDVIKNR